MHYLVLLVVIILIGIEIKTDKTGYFKVDKDYKIPRSRTLIFYRPIHPRKIRRTLAGSFHKRMKP